MNIRPIGKDLEAVCDGCGEVLLLMPGDSVNFRAGPEVDMGGVAVPMPDGILCAACYRSEGVDSEMRVSMKLLRMSCLECGSDITVGDDFETKFGADGGVQGFFCAGCSEPWRDSCDEN